MVTVGLCCNLCAVKRWPISKCRELEIGLKSEYKCFAESSLEPEKKPKFFECWGSSPMHTLLKLQVHDFQKPYCDNWFTIVLVKVHELDWLE